MPPPTLKDLLQQEAQQELLRCASPDWDGYNAAPVTQQHYDDLLRLIDWLPAGVEKPEVVPIPDGGLSLEWWRDSRYVLTIILDGKKLIYAALIGDYKPHGKEALETEESLSRQILLQYFKSDCSSA